MLATALRSHHQLHASGIVVVAPRYDANGNIASFRGDAAIRSLPEQSGHSASRANRTGFVGRIIGPCINKTSCRRGAQSFVALASMAWNTGSSCPAELEMTRSTSAVAFSRSSASFSCLVRASSFFCRSPAEGLSWRGAVGALLRFGRAESCRPTRRCAEIGCPG
jgi:hypothetical protein